MKNIRKSSSFPSIVIIGSGNIGSHLIAQSIHHQFNLIQVISRSDKTILEEQYNNSFEVCESIHSLNKEANIYIIAVNDDNINTIVEEWSFPLHKEQVVIHTSGSLASSTLSTLGSNYGVLWPIQSILKGKDVEWTSLPICYTSSNKYTAKVIYLLSSTLSDHVTEVTDLQREKLHISAVILNNFSNHLIDLVQGFLEEENLKFDLFLPILKETVDRLSISKASALQTGPAARKDLDTIKKHQTILDDNKDLLKIYNIMSQSIMNSKK